jgi:hypothetical protein
VKLEARHYWIAIPDIFSTTPRLREVVLTNNRLDESSSFIVIPWQRITHYRGTFSSERQLQTLTVVPRLVECTLGFRGALNLVPPITATLPNLRRLSLDMHTAVQNITAPVLEDLILFSGTRRELSWILPFLPPCSSTLRRLALRESTICLELIPVLRALPLLAHLVFEYDSGNNAAQIDFFTALSTTNATSDSFICESDLVYLRIPLSRSILRGCILCDGRISFPTKLGWLSSLVVPPPLCGQVHSSIERHTNQTVAGSRV